MSAGAKDRSPDPSVRPPQYAFLTEGYDPRRREQRAIGVVRARLLSEFAISVGLMAAVAVLAVGFWWACSYFEARSYNRITGSHVSTFDAMFVQLRVQEGAKKP